LVIRVTITPAVPESSISVKNCEDTLSLPAIFSTLPPGQARESNYSNTRRYGEKRRRRK
jgi:hypothetical protein